MKSLVVLISFFATSIAMACATPGLCVGDRVIDSVGDRGNIKEVFSNGIANVFIDRRGDYPRSLSALGVKTECSDNICFGERVMTPREDIGTVEEVFSDGQIVVTIDHRGDYVYAAKTLSKSVQCIESVCVKDRAIDFENSVGTIKEIFSNGKANVTLDRRGDYIRLISKLGIQVK